MSPAMSPAMSLQEYIRTLQDQLATFEVDLEALREQRKAEDRKRKAREALAERGTLDVAAQVWREDEDDEDDDKGDHS